jgi:hypothetical protein
MSPALQGHPHKDVFRKAQRLTLPDEIFLEAKKSKRPDQGTYNPDKRYKIQNFAKVTTAKNASTDDVEYLSMQTPGHKYDHSKSDHITKPRALFGKVFAEAKNAETGSKLKKSKSPDVGTYNAPASFRNTQLNGSEKNSFNF